MLKENSILTRIGVFYDGNYFLHVSNFYNYVHEKSSRISISGLHDFIRNRVAYEESKQYRLCQIVDAHYFRGRLNAREASNKGNQLYYDRVFDDILMSEGVTTHYLPVRSSHGTKQEKGIDVWFALEAYELALLKQFDVVVLIASDGDYVPLIRKLNTIGIRVMVLSWDFEYTDDYGNQRITRTSQDLLEEVTYPVAMHEIIENRTQKNDPLIQNLFVPKTESPRFNDEEFEIEEDEDSDFKFSTILSLKNGYGFIKYPPTNLFFHYQSLEGADFFDLQPGDKVKFIVDVNDKGENVALRVSLV